MAAAPAILEQLAPPAPGLVGILEDGATFDGLEGSGMFMWDDDVGSPWARIEGIDHDAYTVTISFRSEFITTPRR